MFDRSRGRDGIINRKRRGAPSRQQLEILLEIKFSVPLSYVLKFIAEKRPYITFSFNVSKRKLYRRKYSK